MEKKLTLGPIQQAWIKSLRENPERQMKYQLGEGDKDNYKSCCLGEGLMVLCAINGEEPNFSNSSLLDGFFGKSLVISFNKLGLRGPNGDFDKPYYDEKLHKTFRMLSSMNDGGMTWPEIADFIEANPDNVFHKSV